MLAASPDGFDPPGLFLLWFAFALSQRTQVVTVCISGSREESAVTDFSGARVVVIVLVINFMKRQQVIQVIAKFKFPSSAPECGSTLAAVKKMSASNKSAKIRASRFKRIFTSHLYASPSRKPPATSGKRSTCSNHPNLLQPLYPLPRQRPNQTCIRLTA